MRKDTNVSFRNNDLKFIIFIIDNDANSEYTESNDSEVFFAQLPFPFFTKICIRKPSHS